jgi:hypothetical protein
VKFVPREISLAPGQAVTLDPASRLQLDPSAKVTADGEVKINVPTISMPQPLAKPKGVIPTITNFTIFKSVPFEKGVVQTGWKFLTSAQRTPTNQYCYYDEETGNPDVDFKIDVGRDEKMLAPKTSSKPFDLVAAFSRCVWFKRDDQ